LQNLKGFCANFQVKSCIEGKGEMPVSQSDILMIAKIIDDAYEQSIHKTK
jgi:hypothetical protein